MTVKATDFRLACGFEVNFAFADFLQFLKLLYKLKRLKQCPLCCCSTQSPRYKPIKRCCFSCTTGEKRQLETLPAGSRGTGTHPTAQGSCNGTSWVLGRVFPATLPESVQEKEENKGWSAYNIIEQKNRVFTWLWKGDNRISVHKKQI